MEQSAQQCASGRHTATIPAIIFANAESGLKIAALTVLDRLVVAIHRGGAGPITIVTDAALPEMKRAKALGIQIQVAHDLPQIEGKVLVARGNVLVQTADVSRCLQICGALVQKKQSVGIGILGTEELAAAIGSSRLLNDLDAALARVPTVDANGVACVVRSSAEAKAAERALWATMTSSSDGFVDKVFNRPVGRFLSKVLIHTPVSPNMVSIASILIGVLGAIFLAEGGYQSALIGAILFQISAIVDCVDGDIARMVFKESPLGKWIDLAGDQIVHISVFAGIAFGVLRNGGEKEIIFLGASAVLGALISFGVVLRGMRQPAGANGSLQKLIDAATNRDFSVIVLALALAGKLWIFVWMAGIGSHLFWITALGLQLTHKPPTRAK
jgi:phosphatidylglycerophosphate synthase